VKLPSTRLIEHLEQQIKDERGLHAADLLLMRETFKQERELHERELQRALTENKRLQDENERLRLALGQPSRVAELPDEPQEPVDPDAPPVFSGTTFQKVQQRAQWMQSEGGKRWMLKQLGTVKPLESGESKAQEKEIH